jgi:hypothetical protein
MHIRQLALVAEDLKTTSSHLRAVFGLAEGFADPGVGTFGLANRVFAVGDTFLEVVSPKEPGTTAGRQLEKRGGDGGYMVIVQAEGSDLRFAAERKRMEALGVRIVFDLELEDIATIHLHPRDIGGAIVSIDRAIPARSWRWAGPDWETRIRHDRVRSLLGAGIEANDPAAMAQRWSDVLEQPVGSAEAGEPCIELGATTLRFLPTESPRGEGLREIDIECPEPERVLAAARERNLAGATRHQEVEIAGVRFRLRDH